MKKKMKCSHCGANMNEHRHTISKSMTIGLSKLVEIGSPINIKKLGLTMYQWNNFQKLRYWDLVEKTFDENGKRIGGTWHATENGARFIKNEITIKSTAWTYRGKVTRLEGDNVTILEVDPNYRTRTQYSNDARAVSLPS